MTHEIHIGEPNEVCAGCRKPFTNEVKPASSVRVVYPRLAVPVSFEYRICADCLAAFKAGGSARDGVIAGIDAYHEGEEANQ